MQLKQAERAADHQTNVYVITSTTCVAHLFITQKNELCCQHVDKTHFTCKHFVHKCLQMYKNNVHFVYLKIQFFGTSQFSV